MSHQALSFAELAAAERQRQAQEGQIQTSRGALTPLGAQASIAQVPVREGSFAAIAQQERLAREAQAETPIAPGRIGAATAGRGIGAAIRGGFEAITGKGRATQFTEDLPEIGEIKGTGNDLQIAAGLLAAVDPDAQIDIIRNAVPDAQFFTDEQNNVIVDFGEGKQAVLNKPGISGQDLTRGIAQALAFLPAGKLALVGKSALARIGIGAAASGATEVGIQKTAQALGSEQPVDPIAVGTATALGGFAEAGAIGIRAAREARATQRAGIVRGEQEFVGASVREAEEATKATGVGLFPAQQTLSPFKLEQQSFVASLPAASQKARGALATQNAQVARAVDDALQAIAPPESLVRGPARFKSAATKAIDARKTTRREAASPIYNSAFGEAPAVQIGPVTNHLVQQIDEFGDGPTGNQLKAILGRISAKTKTVDGKEVAAPRTLKQLHNVKMEIDDLISNTGDNSLGNTAKSALIDVQERLLAQMDEASPLYAEARDVFHLNSPAVDELKDSILGSVAASKDVNLKNIAGRIFNPAETNPTVIRNARKVIQEQDPGAWDDMTRVELERRLGSVRTDLQKATGEVTFTGENVPAQIQSAIFGNTKQRAVLFAALEGNPKAAQNFRYLEAVLNRAKLGRPGGSQTGIRKVIEKRLRGPFGFFRRILKEPLQGTFAIGEDIVFDRNTAATADMLFNPEWAPRMDAIRKLGPENPKGAKALTQLFNDVLARLDSQNQEQEPQQ